eukprot:CAMPEP_0118996244 /NCGR_PEP_ID=MMETSP1173-20130426/59716_1 /TAXON_ID=1034831 /ORGANISM="Rhizochromulina marina cf, Strain CCMP1243" /LENGTH=118 /DNA_ID=CAMNT_0006947627 /DNA_START=35 /DNA_END=387 /DNA_ORIENTATION=-
MSSLAIAFANSGTLLAILVALASAALSRWSSLAKLGTASFHGIRLLSYEHRTAKGSETEKQSGLNLQDSNVEAKGSVHTRGAEVPQKSEGISLRQRRVVEQVEAAMLQAEQNFSSLEA